MGNRITVKQAQAQVDFLNSFLHNSTETSERIDGYWRAIPGRYVIDSAYGGYKLSRYCNNGGGQSDISYYRMTARELYYVVSSMVTMLEQEKQNPAPN